MLSQGGMFPAVGNHESEEPDEYVAYTMRFFGGAIGDPSANTSRPYCNMRVVGNGTRHAAIFDVGPGKIAGTIIDWQGNIADSFTETVP